MKNNKRIGKEKKVIDHFILLLVLIMFSVSSLVFISDVDISREEAGLSAQLLGYTGGDPYLTNWRKSGPGGGGFTMDIRVAPANFFGKNKEGRVYLAEDMHGVFRSSRMNWKTGEVARWEHVWYPIQGVADEMPTKFVTSLAFSGQGSSEKLVVGTRDGIFTFKETALKWEKQNIPERKDFQNMGMSMEYADGRYPWVGIIREVPESTGFLLAGIGDSRESYVIGQRRYGLSALYRSKDGASNWDVIKLPAADEREVVFDIKYLKVNEVIHAFVATDLGVYYSKSAFNENNPVFARISEGIPVNADSASGTRAEIRSVEVLPSADKSSVRLLVSLYGERPGDGGVFEVLANLDSLSSSADRLAWVKMKADSERTFRYIGKLLKTNGSTAESYKVYLGKFNVPYLAVKTHELANWKTIVKDRQSNGDSAYEETWDRSAFGSFEIIPSDLVSSKEPAIYGAWTYGPIFTPGHSSRTDLPRKFYQMFSVLHHMRDGVKYFISRGFDEGGFLGAQPELKPGSPGTLALAAPDNGIQFSEDFARSWSGSPPRERSAWVADYGTPLITGYQARYHPGNPSCLYVSAGPNRFGNGTQNVGEIVINTNGGVGTSSSWSVFAGGKNEVLGLPNAEIHTMIFDQRLTSSGSSALVLGVRGYGIYYGEIASDCKLKDGTGFKKIEHVLLNQKIDSSPGQHHYYSALLFDPYSKDTLYIGRLHPAGGVFRLVLGFDKASGTRLPVSESGFITRVDEVVRGAFDNKGKKRCPLDKANNELAAVQINGIAASRNYLFAAVGYGDGEDISPDNKQCAPTSPSGPVNYYGGIIRMSKTGFSNTTSSEYKNTWIAGGPANIGNIPMKVFQVGAIAVNPVKSREVVAMTTGSTFPRSRIRDGVFAGEDDAKISGLFTSSDEGDTLTFTPWATSFPNALSMRFSTSGRSLYVPTRGNGVWVWQDPR